MENAYISDEICYNLVGEALLVQHFGETEFTNLVEADIVTEEANDHDSRSNLIKRFLGFTLVRQSANVEWAAGIVAGEAAIQTVGANRWATAACVAGGVSVLEYGQSKWTASRIKSSKDKSPVKKSLVTTAYRELAMFTSASWQGAAATVEVNEAYGVESTPNRMRFQSGIFGAAVGLWLTPIPPFAKLNGLAREGLGYMVENPIESAAAGSALSLGVFGVLRGIKAIRKTLSKRHDRDTQIDSVNN